MNIIAKRLIEVLKADNTLTTLLGSNKNIFAKSVQERDRRKDKYIVVSTTVGEDMNNIPAQEGRIEVEGAVSRNVAGAFGILADIMNRLDDILNKGETTLTNSEWKIINFVRQTSPTDGIQIDKETNEFFMGLQYNYIIDESD